jgi:hypothetical protein
MPHSSPSSILHPTHVAEWTGTATEVYESSGVDQQPDYRVSIQSTTCADAATSVTVSSCNVTADVYFKIETRTVNGHKVKDCVPATDAGGDNAYAHYRPSSGAAQSNPNGNGYMSPAYTDDSPLPAKAPAHFHFTASVQPDGSLSTMVIEGHGAGGLRACAASTDDRVSGVVILAESGN